MFMFDLIQFRRIGRYCKALILLFLLFFLIMPGFACEVYAGTDDITVSVGDSSGAATDKQYPNAVVTGAVNQVVITIDSGSFSTDSSYTVVSQDIKGLSKTFSVSNAEEAQALIRSTHFSIASDKQNQTVTITVSGGQTDFSALPSYATIKVTQKNVDGVPHYYGYVTVNPENGYNGANSIRFSDAYALAKKLIYNGQKGYLATITSKAEDEILDNITMNMGWGGGGRVKPADAALNGDTFTPNGNIIGPYVGSTKWYWVCGPEAGQEFSFTNWEINEPNGQISSSKAEYLLMLHNMAQKRWNDVDNSSYKLPGFFVEWSEGSSQGSLFAMSVTTLDRHKHSFSYSASENVITATCSNSDGNCDLPGLVDKLTLTAEDAAYTGNPYGGATTDKATFANANIGDALYYLPDGTTLTNSSNSGALGEGLAPVNIGSYIVKVTVTDKTDSTKTATAIDSFEITKGQRPAGSMYISVTSPIIYGQKPIDLQVVNTLSDTPNTKVYYSTSSVVDPTTATECDLTNLPILDAGTYYFFATAEETDNYASFTTPVAELKVNPKPIGVTWTNTELNYNGVEQGPVATAKEEDLVKSTDTVSLDVSGKQINAGEYTATATSDNTNYVVKDADKQQDYSIKKVELILYPAAQVIHAGQTILSDISVIRAKNLVNNESLESALGTQASLVKVVCNTPYDTKGTYDLLIDKGSVSPANYTISTEAGTLTVTDSGSPIKPDPTDPSCGDIYTETIKEENLPEAQLTSLTPEVAEEVLGEDDVEKVKSGADALIYLDLSDATQRVKTTSGVMDEFNNAKSAGMTMYEDTILDLSLYKRILGSTPTEPEKLTELGTTVSITVEVPIELTEVPSGYTREFEVIRRHVDSTGNASYEKLSASYNNGRITFATNKFSEYALMYIDRLIPVPPTGGGSGDGGKVLPSDSYMLQMALKNKAGANIVPVFGGSYKFVSPKTSDTKEIYVFTALMVVGAAAVVLALKKRKSK